VTLSDTIAGALFRRSARGRTDQLDGVRRYADLLPSRRHNAENEL